MEINECTPLMETKSRSSNTTFPPPPSAQTHHFLTPTYHKENKVRKVQSDDQIRLTSFLTTSQTDTLVPQPSFFDEGNFSVLFLPFFYFVVS